MKINIEMRKKILEGGLNDKVKANKNKQYENYKLVNYNDKRKRILYITCYVHR